MATTAQAVFELTMPLMDSLSDAGVADISDNLEYKNKTLGLLNILIPKCYTASDTYATTAGSTTRPLPALLTALTQNIPLDDTLCRTVLPYGLAALFKASDGDALASFYQQSFEENLKYFRNTIPAVIEDIVDVYAADYEE